MAKRKIMKSLVALVLVVMGAVCLTACDATQEKEIVKETITEIIVLDQLNLNKVYDGKPIEEPFIYSIIGENDFEYTVDWYSGNTKLSESPVNAGQYKLSITINYGEKTETLEKEFEIEKCKIEKPEAPKLTYTGEMQYPFENIDRDIISVVDFIGIDGYYLTDQEQETTFRIVDKANYMWEDGTANDFSVTWSWAKKTCNSKIEIEKEHDGTSTMAIKLTAEHGLVASDLNQGLYLVVNFTSSEVGATVSSYYVAIKNADSYSKLQGFSFNDDGHPIVNKESRFMARCYYNYDFAFAISGKIV